jgi:hypothetical protein
VTGISGRQHCRGQQAMLGPEHSRRERIGAVPREYRNPGLREDGTAIVLLIDEVDGSP